MVEQTKPISQVFIAGLSNSVFKNGYVAGLAERLSCKVLNYSLGASNCGYGLWLASYAPDEVNSSDLVILESFIMDYQNDTGFIYRDLELICRTMACKEKLVVVMWPDKICFDNPPIDAVRAYVSVAKREGVRLINGFDLFREYMLRHGLASSDELFSDVSHVKVEHAREIGCRIADLIANDAQLQKTPVESSSNIRRPIILQVATENDPHVGPPWLRVPIVEVTNFISSVDGYVHGLMLETRHADFSIVTSVGSRRINTYWNPEVEDVPRIIRYVSLPSIRVRRGRPTSFVGLANNMPKEGLYALHSALVSLGV